jgi:D-tyrosyl-tRNA(Tyr) deacylase
VANPLLIVVSEPDPVAPRVAERWGTPPATGEHVDGAALRRLPSGALVLRRPGAHLAEDALETRLPAGLRDQRPTVVFPSVHRSEQQVECLTVHALGNPGARAELGGRPRHWTPTDPARMVAALRALAEGAARCGLRTTYEATHHGPYVELPAFFAEIGFGERAAPPEAAVDLLASVLGALEPESGDRIALAVGGGHYAPHFTDLALRRRWSFGHIVSRHALEELEPDSARAAWTGTPGAEGVVFARAEDAAHPSLAGLGGRLRDRDAPRREPPGTSGGAPPASGT